MKIKPTPLTAAVAGAAAALAWPLIASHSGTPGGSWGIDLIVLTLLAIALPAHLLVVGFERPAPGAERKVDTALLKRIAVWLAVALGVTLARSAMGL
jgi:hypothetical protein